MWDTELRACVVPPTTPRPTHIVTHLVRALNLFELLHVATLVRVVLHGQLTVGLLDLRVRRFLVDSEVQVAGKLGSALC